MRLTDYEIKFIKENVNRYIPSKIYIFGSRLNNEKLGGDLDIYLIPKKAPSLDKIGIIKIILEERLLLKVDIIISKNKTREIEQQALKGVLI